MTTRSEQAVERQTPESSGPVQPDLFGGGSVVQRAAERSRRQKLRLLLEGLPAEEQRALRAFVKHEPDIDLSLLLMRARKERRINRQVAIYLEDCARADRQRERARQLDREAEERRREAARARPRRAGSTRTSGRPVSSTRARSSARPISSSPGLQTCGGWRGPTTAGRSRSSTRPTRTSRRCSSPSATGRWTSTPRARRAGGRPRRCRARPGPAGRVDVGGGPDPEHREGVHPVR
ncbi:MAG: hypothetical protein M5U09_13710 [Gammaproteobacteria bacterium]|nr:hypothetical protein [Gammaproteobacteria bacterium]